MTDSFMHNHQSALDSQREDDAIQYLQDTGVYPDPDDKHYPMDSIPDDDKKEWEDGFYGVPDKEDLAE